MAKQFLKLLNNCAKRFEEDVCVRPQQYSVLSYFTTVMWPENVSHLKNIGVLIGMCRKYCGWDLKSTLSLDFN